MKAKDIIELLEEDGLKKLAIKQTDWIEDLETANESWKDRWRESNEAFARSQEDSSNAWAQHTKSQKRVAELFGKLERIARILNKEEVESDMLLLDEIVEVVSEVITFENGVFINHKGEEV